MLPFISPAVQFKDSRGGMTAADIVRIRHGANMGNTVPIPPRAALRLVAHAKIPEARDPVSALIGVPVTSAGSRSTANVEASPGRTIPTGLFASNNDWDAAASGKKQMECPLARLAGTTGHGADGMPYLALTMTNRDTTTTRWADLMQGGIYVYDSAGNFVAGNFFNGGGPIPDSSYEGNGTSLVPDKDAERRYTIYPPPGMTPCCLPTTPYLSNGPYLAFAEVFIPPISSSRPAPPGGTCKDQLVWRVD